MPVATDPVRAVAALLCAWNPDWDAWRKVRALVRSSSSLDDLPTALEKWTDWPELPPDESVRVARVVASLSWRQVARLIQWTEVNFVARAAARQEGITERAFGQTLQTARRRIEAAALWVAPRQVTHAQWANAIR